MIQWYWNAMKGFKKHWWLSELQCIKPEFHPCCSIKYRNQVNTTVIFLKIRRGRLWEVLYGTRMNQVPILAIEVFKCTNGINPAYLNELLITHESKSDLRNQTRLLQSKFNRHMSGHNSFRYLGSKLCNSLPSHLKIIDDMDDFR